MSTETHSYWHKTASSNKYPPLLDNLEVDNLIVGGGITGVTAAYLLGEKGYGDNTVLIEKDEIASGGSGNTTAKISLMHDNIYSRLLKEQNISTAKMYYQAQSAAVDFIKDTIRKEKIECNYIGNTGYLYSDVPEEAANVEKEFEAAARLEIPSKFLLQPPFPKNCINMAAFYNQGVFHPIKYLNALCEKAVKKGVRIFTDTAAVGVKDADTVTVTLKNGTVIKAKNLIIATQYPFYEDKNFFFSKLYAKRGYLVAALCEKDFPDGSYKKSGNPPRSLRKCYEGGECVCIAQGETHPTGRSEDMQQKFDNVAAFLNDELTIKKELARWSMQDYETPDGMPFIGKIDKKSHIYVGTGYGRWGMSNGTLAGMILSDLIAAGGNRFEDLFSPLRKIKISPIINMTTEVTNSVGELIKSKTEPHKSDLNLQPGEGRVIVYEGQTAGVYCDKNGIATILDITCSHMGTTLNFNSFEKTWDCPAHGSRFAVDGTVLEGPAKKQLKILYTGKWDSVS